MKRHLALRDLSVEHHHGLVFAQRLQKVELEDQPGQISMALTFIDFWDSEVSIHFRKEEVVLLPVFARYGGEIGQEPIAEMLTHHARIRGFVMELKDQMESAPPNILTLENIGCLLEVHIRLEERVIFPAIEDGLPEHALIDIADRLRGDAYGERVSKVRNATMVRPLES